MPCNKNFKTGTKLNGGVMILWCRHRVCVGFHMIQTGEGPNDVFSPLYTRWKKPPRTIIYDYACQLMPYNTVSPRIDSSVQSSILGLVY